MYVKVFFTAEPKVCFLFFLFTFCIYDVTAAWFMYLLRLFVVILFNKDTLESPTVINFLNSNRFLYKYKGTGRVYVFFSFILLLLLLL
jgi:hypothetical protein